MNMSLHRSWDDGGGPRETERVNFRKWDEAHDAGQGMCPCLGTAHSQPSLKMCGSEKRPE